MTCATCDDLFINNDVTIALEGLYDKTDSTSASITDATVTAKIYASSDLNTMIGSQIVLAYVTATDEYLGVIDAATPLVDGTEYTIIITVTASGGRDGEWRLVKEAKYQIADC